MPRADDTSSVIAVRIPDEILHQLDMARDAQANGGILLSRSAFLKNSLYWYMTYLGYKPIRPTVGGRARSKP